MLNIKPQNLFLVVFNLRYFNLPRFQAAHNSLFTRGYIANVYDSFRFFIEVLTEICEHLNYKWQHTNRSKTPRLRWVDFVEKATNINKNVAVPNNSDKPWNIYCGKQSCGENQHKDQMCEGGMEQWQWRFRVH